MATQTEEEDPLIEKYHGRSSSSSSLPSLDSSIIKKSRIRTASTRLAQSPLPLLLNVAFIIFNVFLSQQTDRWVAFHKHYCPDNPYSPKDTGIKYENTIMYTEHDKSYGGDLGPSVDAAWDKLMFLGSMRVSKEEMEHFGELGDDSAELEHGGYLTSLRVFHELHCMDWIKRSYSNPNATFSGNFREIHLDHCLNIIRQGVQCRGDTTTSSWYSEPDNLGKPLIQQNHAVETCVDWSTVEKWIEPRLLKWDHLGVLEGVIGRDGGVVPMEDWLKVLKPT